MLIALLLACNVENTLDPKDRDTVDTLRGPIDSPTDTIDTPLLDECDGLDNDQDERIDEDAPDADGDGYPDCMDFDCPDLGPRPSAPVEQNGDCAVERGGGLWDVKVLWRLESVSTFTGDPISGATPILAQLDEDPALEVAVTLTDLSWANGTMVVVDGATGLEQWAAGDSTLYMDSLAADLDGDGVAELLTLDPNSGYAPLVLNADGSAGWTTSNSFSGDLGSLTAADLDGDGLPEVLAGGQVYEGLTGAQRFTLSVPYGFGRFAIGDIDLDGDQEIAYRDSVFDSDGTLLWTLPGTSPALAYPAMVQADSDPEAEIAWSADSYTLWDTDGTLLHETRPFSSGSKPGPTCVADFDGDGDPELVAPRQQELVALELDGTVLWTATVADTSSQAGCAAADLDADGDAELIFADEQDLWILDGATGTALLQYPTHSSMTWSETPSVADVDADGHLDIVFSSNTDSARKGVGAALTVLTNDGPGWAASDGAWNSHDHCGQIDPQGQVSVTDYWNSRGFREQPSSPAEPTLDGVADPALLLVDACLADCLDGPARIMVQVYNPGLAAADAGGVLSVYALSGGAEVLLAVDAVDVIPAGWSLDAVTFELPASWLTTEGLRLRLEPAGEDCDPDNNTLELLELSCP